jgi:hypothetical protein
MSGRLPTAGPASIRVHLRFLSSLSVLCALCGSVLFAQNYQCNWSVVDQGGGLMTSTSYRATPSVGQTAIGLISSTGYQAYIGFWQIDTATSGIHEESRGQAEAPLVTMLYAPFPNPLSSSCVLRYSLSAGTHVSLQLFDLTGRSVEVLVNSTQQPGRYSLALNRPLARGVYFLALRTADYQATRKLILQ